MTLCGPLQTAFTHLRISYLPMPLARDRSLPSAGLFTVACVLVWTSFSLAAMLLQWGLDSAGMLSQTMATSSVIIAGVVLIAAGVCQCSLSTPVCTIVVRRWRFSRIAGAPALWEPW